MLFREVLGRARLRDLAELDPDGLQRFRAHLGHDLGNLVRRHDARQELLYLVGGGQEIAAGAQVLREFLDELIERRLRDGAEIRGRLRDELDVVFVEVLEQPCRNLAVHGQQKGRDLFRTAEPLGRGLGIALSSLRQSLGHSLLAGQCWSASGARACGGA